MKRFAWIILLMSLIGSSAAQSGCFSNRYIDTIFHQVKVTTKYFGTATPFGLLAQPQDMYLDLYEPVGDTLSRRPLIVFQFGGGFTIGWRSEPDIPAFCEYFAKCGYVVASIDYRIGLNPLDTGSTVRAFYRGVQDERSAIRFLCDSAAKFRFDTSYIFLTGTSAGCFCALANSYMTNADRPLSTYGTFLEPDDMGCMDCSGNNNFNHHIPHIKGIINQWGAVLDTNYITAAENVPVISFHGDQDILVPYVYGYPFQLPVFPPVYGSVPIHQRLNNQGILNEFHTLVGYGHEPELLAPQLNDTIYNYSRVFLYGILKPANPSVSGTAEICLGSTAGYSVPASPQAKYCWQLNGNGQIIANTGNAITVLWADTGNVSVSIQELNFMQVQTDPQTFTTHVVPHPVSDFSYVANELDVSLSNISTNATSYYWQLGDGTFSVDTNPAKVYTAGGTYIITLVAGNSICTDTSSTQITIDSCPASHFTVQLNGFNGFFYADTTNTLLYYWNFGDGDSAAVNSPNVFHQYQQYGTYEAVLRVINQLGCEEIDTVMLSIVNTGLQSDVKLFNAAVLPDLKGIILKGTTEAVNLQLLDVSGRVIYRQTIQGDGLWPLPALPACLYLIRLNSGSQQQIIKAVKAG